MAARISFKGACVNAALAQSRFVKSVRVHEHLGRDAKRALGDLFQSGVLHARGFINGLRVVLHLHRHFVRHMSTHARGI